MWQPKEVSITSPNDGTTWSSGLSWSGGSVTNPTFGFDSSTTTTASGGTSGTLTWTPPSAISGNLQISVPADPSGTSTITLSDSTQLTVTSDSFADFGTVTNITSVTVTRGNNSGMGIKAVKLDGVILVDGVNEYGTNGFSLDFSDNSSNTALGTDSSGENNNWSVNNISISDGTISTANGALPILNTTGNYGGTVGSGTRTDSNSSNIVLALPMNGTNGGTTFTDQHAIIKGSGSAKTVTVSNVTTDTAQSFFYGSSALFNSTSDKLTVPTGGSGGDIDFEGGSFTIECWCYANSINPGSAHLVSCWVDPSPLSFLLSMGGGGSQNKFTFGAAGGNAIDSTGRSAGQWYHVAGVRDGNTLRLFVNGQQSATSACSGDVTDPPSDVTIGQMSNNSSANWNGYISDLRIYKGVAKYTSAFSPPSRTGGSGCDSLIDSPTNGTQTDTGAGGEVVGNYATLNPLNSALTLTNGNLDSAGISGWTGGAATIGMSSGKWYWEIDNVVSNEHIVGIVKGDVNPITWNNTYGYGAETGVKYLAANGVPYGDAWTTGDVINVQFDADNGILTFYKNGISQGVAATGLTDGPYFPSVVQNGSTRSSSINFGQRPFAYTAPSGYKALCTTNLDDLTIANGSTAMDVALYTPSSTPTTVSGLGFSPDLVWIKSRSAVANNSLFDTIRGATKFLYSNLTNAEAVGTQGLQSFTSDGFTTGSSVDTGANGTSYVAWAWDAGTSTVSNTDGSITSSVRANASAGFSIVSYTGTGSSATVGHGLNSAPSFIVIKNRDGVYNWATGHDSIEWTKYLYLNTTASSATSSAVWNNTSPTSSVFSVGGSSASNRSADDHVAYCFAPVDGYSSFGIYTGNGSTDGPFVYTGFRPKWLLLKCSTLTELWMLHDSTRDPDNVVSNLLQPHTSDAEIDSVADYGVDFLSNGFKFRSSSNRNNGSGQTYIYAAFAENPFKTARAR